MHKLLIATVFAGLALPAMAAPITFTGNTTAVLSGGWSGNTSFNAAAVNVTTNASGTSSNFSLGTLSYTSSSPLGAFEDPLVVTLHITGGPFAGVNVALNFDLFGFTSGFPTFAHTADIWGDLTGSQLVTVSNASGTGSFNLSLAGSLVTASELLGISDAVPHRFTGGSGSILATITNATFTPAPEPLSLAVLGTGLLGLGIARVLRRTKSALPPNMADRPE